MAGYRVALVGATGMVGQEFLKVLQQRKFPMASLSLFASKRSAGKRVAFNGTELEVKETTDDSFPGLDIIFMSSLTEVNRHFTPLAVRAGAAVVDDSNAFRMEPAVPLVVPEVNGEDIAGHRGIVANPNCSTIQMVVALAPLHRANPIKRIIVSTYQAVSGTGYAAVQELDNQARRVLAGGSANPQVYPHQIAFNLLPEIDSFTEEGYTKEEWKMVRETRKILHAPDIALTATCVRVPVFFSHSEVVNIEFTHPMSPEEARRILSQAPGVKVVDDPKTRLYPYPLKTAGTDDVFVGRIRRDISTENGLVLWVVADNIRKGAALNCVQIAEEMIKRNCVRPGGQK